MNYELYYLCYMKILMVCLGNICRSPLAEGILQDMAAKAGLNWTVDSAGTNGYHTGEPPHHLSVKVARDNGLDISRQRSRRFTAADLEHYELIYAMAADVIADMERIAGKKMNSRQVKLLLNESHAGEPRDVPDPWYGPEQGYHEVFRIISEACNSIVKKYINREEIKYA